MPPREGPSSSAWPVGKAAASRHIRHGNCHSQKYRVAATNVAAIYGRRVLFLWSSLQDLTKHSNLSFHAQELKTKSMCTSIQCIVYVYVQYDSV